MDIPYCQFCVSFMFLFVFLGRALQDPFVHANVLLASLCCPCVQVCCLKARICPVGFSVCHLLCVSPSCLALCVERLLGLDFSGL